MASGFRVSYFAFFLLRWGTGRCSKRHYIVAFRFKSTKWTSITFLSLAFDRMCEMMLGTITWEEKWAREKQLTGTVRRYSMDWISCRHFFLPFCRSDTIASSGSCSQVAWRHSKSIENKSVTGVTVLKLRHWVISSFVLSQLALEGTQMQVCHTIDPVNALQITTMSLTYTSQQGDTIGHMNNELSHCMTGLIEEKARDTIWCYLFYSYSHNCFTFRLF